MEPSDRETQLAAIELARWQGKMDERIGAVDGRFKKIDRALERIEEKQDARFEAIEGKQDEQGEELITIKVKFALYAAAGNVVFGLLVAWGSKAIGL